jgi:hypothetical protein
LEDAWSSDLLGIWFRSCFEVSCLREWFRSYWKWVVQFGLRLFERGGLEAAWSSDLLGIWFRSCFEVSCVREWLETVAHDQKLLEVGGAIWFEVV